MKFLIERASNWSLNKEQPCKNAKLLKKGDTYYWGIDINSLEELLSIIDETNASIIIDDCNGNFEGYKHEITIYDDFIE